MFNVNAFTFHSTPQWFSPHLLSEMVCQVCSHAGCETSFGIFLKCICSHCNDRNCFASALSMARMAFVAAIPSITGIMTSINMASKIPGGLLRSTPPPVCRFCNCNLRTVICQQHFYDFSIKLIILDRQQMQSTNIILLCNFLILFLFPGNLKRMVMTNTDPTPTWLVTSILPFICSIKPLVIAHSQTGSLINTTGICFSCENGSKYDSGTPDSSLYLYQKSSICMYRSHPVHLQPPLP